MRQHRKQREMEIQYCGRGNVSDINDKLILNLLDIKNTMGYLYKGKGSQQNILILLYEVRSISQRELTEMLGIQPGIMRQIVDACWVSIVGERRIIFVPLVYLFASRFGIEKVCYAVWISESIAVIYAVLVVRKTLHKREI